jgi:beta-phosphoglucomutase-like phosphatase (HAD superfamily)
MHALIFDLDGTLVDSVYAHVLGRPRPLPGAVEIFRALGAARIPHAIATARWTAIGCTAMSGRAAA